MKKKLKKAVVSWTGGKDCALALYEAKELGYEIVALVTFTPKNAKFLAHPLQLMKYQAKAMGFVHDIVEIAEPYKESYKKAIKLLRKKYKIDAIVTGDIAEVGSCTNWMQECSESTGVSILRPLWHRDRNEIVNKLIDCKFEVIFSGVKEPWFTADWVGVRLDNKILDRLKALHTETGLDICGENGEYHTQVLDGPLFRKSIKIDSYLKQTKDSLSYIDIQKMTLRDKN
jgi:uncharacterized protein (TIGR00290 family)